MTSPSDSSVTTQRTIGMQRATKILWLLGALGLATGCASSESPGGGEAADAGGADAGETAAATLTGTIAGTVATTDGNAIIAKREPGSPLNLGTGPGLDIYIGESDTFINTCPDVAFKKKKRSLKIRIGSDSLVPGTYELCVFGAECGPKRAEFSWRDETTDGLGSEAKSGSVSLTSVDGNVKGSFTATFENGTLNGTFDGGVSCTDSRKR